MSKFPVGSKVRFTAKFLKSTGQYAGREPNSKWTVQECPCSLCKSGSHVCTDQKHPSPEGLWTSEELEEMPYLRFRHVAVSNIEKVK